MNRVAGPEEYLLRIMGIASVVGYKHGGAPDWRPPLLNEPEPQSLRDTAPGKHSLPLLGDTQPGSHTIHIQ